MSVVLGVILFAIGVALFVYGLVECIRESISKGAPLLYAGCICAGLPLFGLALA